MSGIEFTTGWYRANIKLSFRVDISRIETIDEMNIPFDHRNAADGPVLARAEVQPWGLNRVT